MIFLMRRSALLLITSTYKHPANANFAVCSEVARRSRKLSRGNFRRLLARKKLHYYSFRRAFEVVYGHFAPSDLLIALLLLQAVHFVRQVGAFVITDCINPHAKCWKGFCGASSNRFMLKWARESGTRYKKMQKTCDFGIFYFRGLRHIYCVMRDKNTESCSSELLLVAESDGSSFGKTRVL